MGPGRRAHGGVPLLLLFLLGLGLAGCSSIYRETEAWLPPEPRAQLKLRIEEAERAEQHARQTITALRDGLNAGKTSTATETDVDRMATAAFDFDRRVASARDAAAHCAFDPQLTNELERLQGRSRRLLDYVQAMGASGNSIDARQLDDLLKNLAKP